MISKEVTGGWGREPVFVSSYESDRCLPACVAMVLKTAGIPITDQQVDMLTGYQKGLYSQFSLATIALSLFIPDVHLYSWLDFHAYAQSGEEYLKQVFRRHMQYLHMPKTTGNTTFLTRNLMSLLR